MNWYIWLRFALAVVLLVLGVLWLFRGDFQVGLLILVIAQLNLMESRLEIMDDKIDSIR